MPSDAARNVSEIREALKPGDRVLVVAEVECPPDEYGAVEVNVYGYDNYAVETISVPMGNYREESDE